MKPTVYRVYEVDPDSFHRRWLATVDNREQAEAMAVECRKHRPDRLYRVEVVKGD